MTFFNNKLYNKKLQQMVKLLAKEDIKLYMKSNMISDFMDSIDDEPMGNEEE